MYCTRCSDNGSVTVDCVLLNVCRIQDCNNSVASKTTLFVFNSDPTPVWHMAAFDYITIQASMTIYTSLWVINTQRCKKGSQKYADRKMKGQCTNKKFKVCRLHMKGKFMIKGNNIKQLK